VFGDIFYWLFSMSVSAALCGVPVLILRRIKAIPRRVLVFAWIIPFARMCIPVSLSSKYSVMALLSEYAARSVTVYVTGLGTDVTMMNFTRGADSYFPITYKVDVLEEVFWAAAVVWLIVFLAAVFTFFIIYIVTAKELKDARIVGNNVYLSDKIRTPSVYGILSPRIIIPREYGGEELKYILMHEKAHIKRRDNLTRTAALAVACVHWFNPIAWLYLKCLYNDIELACDEAVLAKCASAEKKEYAHVLLSAAEDVNVFASTFGGAKIRVRIENILSYKKLSLFSSVALFLLIAAIAFVLLTNA